jgi:hypothetical protein
MINAWPELTPAMAGGFWVNILMKSPLTSWLIGESAGKSGNAASVA